MKYKAGGTAHILLSFCSLFAAVLSDYDSADPEENGSHSEVSCQATPGALAGGLSIFSSPPHHHRPSYIEMLLCF